MNYYYDLLINLQADTDYMFYEWNKTDDLINIKKIPIIRVNKETMKDIYCYQIRVNEELLLFIKDKTKAEKKTLKYVGLFSDGDYSIVLEFNNNGKVIKRSRLLIEDENNVNEISYNMKIQKINYIKEKIIKHNKELRQSIMVKKFIKEEIDLLIESNDLIKLKYLFLEWFNYEEDDQNIIINKMKTDLNKDFNKVHEHISYLIKLSYKNKELSTL